jgi:hypothetical protein
VRSFDKNEGRPHAVGPGLTSKLSGLSSDLNFETLFPLRFRSNWGGADFNDFEGVFERPE